MMDLGKLVRRYVALWNEADAARRRQEIVALWTEDAAHLTPSFEARGRGAIEARITAAFEKWVMVRP